MHCSVVQSTSRLGRKMKMKTSELNGSSKQNRGIQKSLSGEGLVFKHKYIFNEIIQGTLEWVFLDFWIVGRVFCNNTYFPCPESRIGA